MSNLESGLAKRDPNLEFTKEKQTEVCESFVSKVEDYFKFDLDSCWANLNEIKKSGFYGKEISFKNVDQLYPPGPFLVEETKQAQELMRQMDVNPYSQTVSDRLRKRDGNQTYQDREAEYYSKLNQITKNRLFRTSYGYEKFQEGYEPEPYILVDAGTGITQYLGSDCDPKTVGNYIFSKIEQINNKIDHVKSIANGMKETPFISKKDFEEKFQQEILGVVPGFVLQQVLDSKK